MTKFKKMTHKQLVFYSLLLLSFVSSIVFINYNHAFYERTIVEVIEEKIENTSDVVDMYNNEDKLYNQNLIAKIKNGENKNDLVYLENDYSFSKAFDQQYAVGNELFVEMDSKLNAQNQLTATIKDLKRDKYIVLIAWIFAFVLLMIGKRQGLFSVVSLAVNALLLSFALDVYVKYPNINLVLICGISAIFFTAISLLLVNGFNEKTYAAIIATLIGTFASLLITYIVMRVTSENGLRYEEMQFLTRPYKMVFMAGLVVGSLGAVMDVAITMSSSIFGLYEKDQTISIEALKKSGMDIGKDVMGTMTNILFFVYISGTIPMILLYLSNDTQFSFTLSMNLSLELARALAGGIGIVLTIPIGLYITIFFVNRKKARI